MTIQRKIIGFDYSRMICLPKYWIEQHNLKPKDTVDIQLLKDGSLLIKPGTSKTNETA